MGLHAGLRHVVLNVIFVPSGLLNKILYEGGDPPSAPWFSPSAFIHHSFGRNTPFTYLV